MRVVLVSGKGGVGKTTISGATGVASARRGKRTLVLSFDVAHSLSDCFDLDRQLFDQHHGLPFEVADGLHLQEIDIQEEIERNWSSLQVYVGQVLASMGVSDVVAEELAIFPGMEDVIALLYLNKYVREKTYDTIVVDCPPTGESLRFISLTATLEWYMRRRFNRDRALMKLVRPVASRFSDVPVPGDDVYDFMKGLFTGLQGINDLLTDPKTTTVRLVTNAEKMVVRETQRAYMYFNMFGMTTDLVVINRLMSEADGYYARWAETQATYSDQIREYFAPVPVVSVPLMAQEVIGIDRLAEVAAAMYGTADPVGISMQAPPYSITKTDGEYTLALRMPFATKEALDISRHLDDLIVRVGSFKRYVPLPRSAARLDLAGAVLRDGQLSIRLVEHKSDG